MKTQYTPEQLKTLESFDLVKVRDGRVPVTRDGEAVENASVHPSGVIIGLLRGVSYTWDYYGRSRQPGISVLTYLAPAETPGYIHAQVLADYAEDAQKHAEPWKGWQGLPSVEVGWVDCTPTNHPGQFAHWQYRRKPQTRKVAAYEAPMPMTEAPPEGTFVWYVDITRNTPVQCFEWAGYERGKRLLERGNVYHTKADAWAAHEAEMKAKGVAL